jgi:hypothetical protein
MKNISTFIATFLLFIFGANLALAGFGEPPTEIINLIGTRNNERVKLSWTTTSEAENMGFEVLRRLGDEKEFSKIGFVDGFGTSEVSTHYTFGDINKSKYECYYQLKQIDINGVESYSEIVTVKGFLSDNLHTIVSYMADKNELEIQFGLLLETQTNATVKVIDAAGTTAQEFAVAVASHKSFGIDTGELLAGEYFIFIDFNDKSRQVLDFKKP